MRKADPAWLGEAREICKQAGIKIAGFGSDSLVVHANFPAQALDIASRLKSLGLQPVENEDDSNAGLLTLSRSPEVTRATEREARARYGDFSRRPRLELLMPFLELSLAFGLSLATKHPTQTSQLLAALFFGVFLWDGARIWGWRLRINSNGVAVRRYFRWTAVPWDQIRAVDTAGARSRNQEAVMLDTWNGRLRLGGFGYQFARALRDHLREEIGLNVKQRQVPDIPQKPQQCAIR